MTSSTRQDRRGLKPHTPRGIDARVTLSQRGLVPCVWFSHPIARARNKAAYPGGFHWSTRRCPAILGRQADLSVALLCLPGAARCWSFNVITMAGISGLGKLIYKSLISLKTFIRRLADLPVIWPVWGADYLGVFNDLAPIIPVWRPVIWPLWPIYRAIAARASRHHYYASAKIGRLMVANHGQTMRSHRGHRPIILFAHA